MAGLDTPAGDGRRRGVPADEPPRPASAGHLIGRAEASATRVESLGGGLGRQTTLTFRLLDVEGRGSRDVLLCGRTISGTVRDGDWVEARELDGAPLLALEEVLDLTTGRVVRVRGGSRTALAWLWRTALVVLVLLILLLAVHAVSGGSSGAPSGTDSPAGDGRLDPGST